MEAKQVVLQEVKHESYQGKDFRKIITDQGTFNIKEGKNGCLKNKWDLLEHCIGKTITLEMGEYLGKPYVADLILPVPSSQAPQQPIQPIKGIPQPTNDNRLKSMSLAYAKDLVVAGMIGYSDIYNCASDFEKYMEGSFKPSYRAGWDIK